MSIIKIHNQKLSQAGFTLVETIVAILILTSTIGALLTLAAGGYFSVRYSRNDIVANNLLQESLEYIRNDRDTRIMQGGSDWNTWLTHLNVAQDGTIMSAPLTRGCFSSNGCTVDPYTSGANIKECPANACSTSPLLYYPDQGFYGYNVTYPQFSGGTAPYTTSFVRTVKAEVSSTDPNQIIVTATITWLNGTTQKRLTQSMIITNWILS